MDVSCLSVITLRNRTLEFHASYQSLSGEKYKTKFLIEDGITRE